MKIRFSTYRGYYGSGSSSYTYYITKKIGKVFITYVYEVGTRTTKGEKPVKSFQTKTDSIEEIKKVLKTSTEIKDSQQTLEELELFIPEPFSATIPENKVTRDEEITDAIMLDLAKSSGEEEKSNIGYPFIYYSDYYDNENESEVGFKKIICGNPACKGHLVEEKIRNSYWGKEIERQCPICKAKDKEIIATKEVHDYYKKNFDCERSYQMSALYIDRVKTKEDFFYIFKNPENENGIIVYLISKELSVKSGKVLQNYMCKYSLTYTVGEEIKCLKHLKKSKKECDPFEMFNINSKNINSTWTRNLVYENNTSFLEFAYANEKFMKMCGFQTTLMYSKEKLSIEPFFIVFLAIFAKYPMMEQIVKMGHIRLFFSLYESMLTSTNKESITSKVEGIQQIINFEAKKGKDMLRFPSYIGEYLIKKGAELEEYYYWRDMAEIVQLSKEQFEKFIGSFNFAWVNGQCGLKNISNILKFNYEPEKLFSYIVKQARKTNNDCDDVIELLEDYLNMCDMTEIEPDKFPQDLVKIHDDMTKYFKERKKAAYDKILTSVANDCKKYVVPEEDELDRVGIPKLFEEYTVIFPENEAAFINEGNQQHNCVGSYPRRVREGNCVIFFIRKKETPHISFITAECTNGGLGQCYYSNNRRVEDENLRKFARYISNKILTGVSSGKIKALSNIKYV